MGKDFSPFFFFKKRKLSWAREVVQPLKVAFLCLSWWHTSSSQHLGGRGKAIYKFKVSLVYISSTRPASATLSQKQFYPCIHVCMHLSLHACIHPPTHSSIHLCVCVHMCGGQRTVCGSLFSASTIRFGRSSSGSRTSQFFTL